MRASTQDFNLAVYEIVKAIPPRKVITCGHIAKLLGVPKQARQVRNAVNFISHMNPPVAWHRVISTSGVISTHGANAQQHLLEVEGVEVYVGIVGETRVMVDRWGWSPKMGDPKLGMRFEAEEETEWGA
ncbi:hypothetical protein PAXRUDRAFT_822354 [Paxillus rubicundulus Ve08.2h10]|uniref:Methylated-DNA-[protein]-cysteine S-methyltransferase DNA binding domain-containing protein n=1 Tax=Paxillus rubicundulus Ve08.2h10 TaxID=930991 RepID=A0A0D0E5C7_9AGAM|nr:hypothetical protein PAXRUDRAFT_822354 [Paxillus rubicundulus Ve08.2h10]